MEENNPKDNKDISDFMLSEYQNISSAHFETAKQISSFFRYYLIIISTSSFIIFFFDKNQDNFIKLISGENTGLNGLICALFIIISLVGLLVCCFIINKKFNSILYARTVNSIRKFFKERASRNISSYLVLKLENDIPKYFQFSFFTILLSFAIINSAFIFFAFWVVNLKCLGFILSLILFFAHICIYLFWAHYKEINDEKYFTNRA